MTFTDIENLSSKEIKERICAWDTREWKKEVQNKISLPLLGFLFNHSQNYHDTLSTTNKYYTKCGRQERENKNLTTNINELPLQRGKHRISPLSSPPNLLASQPKFKPSPTTNWNSFTLKCQHTKVGLEGVI